MNSSGHGSVNPKRKRYSRKRFFLRITLKSDYLEIELSCRQSTLSFEVSGAFSTPVEKPTDRFIHTPGDAAVGLSLSESAAGVDLGDSDKFSHENLES